MAAETNCSTVSLTYLNDKDYVISVDGVEMSTQNLLDENMRQKMLSAPKVFFATFVV